MRYGLLTLPSSPRHAVRITDYYSSLIDPGDPDCPIRKMCMPSAAELQIHPLERDDPIGDGAHAVTPILVHRYPDRALLFPTFRCLTTCRYCFRRAALSAGEVRLRAELGAALDYLRAHPRIVEVILSGGDPLSLSDDRLDAVLEALRGVPSVRRLRIHTRAPATAPGRVTAALAERLAARRPLCVVTCFNHPKELTPEAAEAVAHLVDRGITVLNQAVLLAGVNDDAGTLMTLFSGLWDWQVGGYYLHHPDLAPGTGHFRVSLRRGRALAAELRGRLSGPALPTYVIDIPGGGGKVPAEGPRVEPIEPGVWCLHSPFGGTLRYVDPAE